MVDQFPISVYRALRTTFVRTSFRGQVIRPCYPLRRNSFVA